MSRNSCDPCLPAARFLVVRLDGIVLGVNAALRKLNGHEAAEGTAMDAIVHPDDRIRAVQEREAMAAGEAQARSVAGHLVPMDGRIISVIGAVSRHRTRYDKGLAAVDFGLALHAGEVAYGNIGGRSRLDFTVIGPAVNFTSRMLERTKTAGRLLISETFATASQLPFIDLGVQTLRDIEGEHRMFTIPDA